MKNWVVVFNRTEAKIYQHTAANKPLTLVRRLENPLGREKNRAMTTDKPGRELTRFGSTKIGHSLNSELDPHEDAAIQFMRTLASSLELDRAKGSFERLTLVADPHMTGLLKAALDKTTSKVVDKCILKNLSKMPEHEIVHIMKPNTTEGVSHER